jgi:CBS domain containing-hemolysin-like protein
LDDPGPQTILVTDFNLVAVFATVVLLLFFSAVVSAAEVALFSLSPDDIAALRTKNIRKAGIIATLIETPRKLLATLSITNTIINVSAIVLFFSAQPFSGLPYVWLQVVTG